MYELWEPGGKIIIEDSEAVETATHKAVFRIIDRGKTNAGTTDPEERIAWAIALSRLARFTSSFDGIEAPVFGKEADLPIKLIWKGSDGMEVAARLAHTIGRQMVAFDEAPDIDLAIDDCAAAFKSALKGFTAWSRRDKRLSTESEFPLMFPLQFALIAEARNLFEVTRKRPDKQTLRRKLESLDFRMSGKGQAGKWEDAFNKAGLGNLPASPAS
jgi:hypothetical protein